MTWKTPAHTTAAFVLVQNRVYGRELYWGIAAMTTVSTVTGATTGDADVHDGGLDEAKLDNVGQIVSSAVKWSAAAGLVPLPFVDLVALGAVQTRMLMDLSNVYGHSFGKEAANAIVSVLLGTLIPGAAAGAVMKAVPGVGTLAGIASVSAFGAAATYAIGKVFARHLAGGGKPGDFSATSIAEDLKAEFRRGKPPAAT
jgi:uncharacterized protein (DUF697 family)